MTTTKEKEPSVGYARRTTQPHLIPVRAGFTQPPPSHFTPTRRKHHPLVFVGISMFVFLCIYLAANFWIIPFVQGVGNHWQYGEGHIAQYDFNVDHGGMSHFLAQDYKGTIVIIEIVEAGKFPSYVYTSPFYSSNTANPVVLLSLTDANNDGKPDLAVRISGDPLATILYNNGTTFQMTPPGAP